MHTLPTTFTATETNVESALYDLLCQPVAGDSFGDVLDADPDEQPIIDDVRTFEAAAVLTYNRGLVLALADGSEFQITIVQSRHGGDLG